MKETFMWVGGIIVGALALIVLMSFVRWKFPTGGSSVYGWVGAWQVCATTKGWDTFQDHTVCFDIK